jgi:hypothetical protein
MPVYLDFMLVFGAQSDAKDLRYSGFREQVRLKTPSSEHVMPELGRSGKHFQLCYNLKGVQFKHENNENIKLNEWSIRDCAFYHQFDVEYGTTLWIVTKGGRDVLDRYDELTGPKGRPDDKEFHDPPSSFRSTLAAHLLYCNWSTEDWRWYIVWLEHVVEQEVSIFITKDANANMRLFRAAWLLTDFVVLTMHTRNTNHGIYKTCNIGKTRPMRQPWYWSPMLRF